MNATDNGTPIRLLIVDDEAQYLAAIAQRLTMRGFDVQTASDGQTAVDIARREKFDLALLDLKMPGMNGRQVLEILKQEHKHIEVVILTGHGSLDSAVECTKMGAFGYLPKPYELDHLIETLKDAFAALEFLDGAVVSKWEGIYDANDKLLEYHVKATKVDRNYKVTFTTDFLPLTIYREAKAEIEIPVVVF